MESEDVIELIRQLSENSGSYCRLLQRIVQADDLARTEWLKQFKDCNSQFEVVQKLEGW